LLKDHAENQQNNDAADSDVRAAQLEAAAPVAAGFVPAVLDVLAFSAWCPPHCGSPRLNF
jgi:hypothetical protein